MAKKQKTPDGCIFCGGRPLSHEHFWPQWAAPYLPADGTHWRALTRGWVNGEDEIVRRDWKRQGHVGVITIPAVCNPCNNGWMNDLEQSVRPVIEPILRGERVLLSPDDQSIISTYIAMKLMVADQSIIEDAIFSPEEHRAMFQQRAIPPNLSIDLLRFTGSTQHVMSYNRESAILRVGDLKPWEGIAMANFTWRFGPMFIHALELRLFGPSPASKGDSPSQIRLHPPLGQARAFPPLLDLTEEQAYRAQHMLQASQPEGMNAPDVLRRRPPKQGSPEDRR